MSAIRICSPDGSRGADNHCQKLLMLDVAEAVFITAPEVKRPACKAATLEAVERACVSNTHLSHQRSLRLHKNS